MDRGCRVRVCRYMSVRVGMYREQGAGGEQYNTRKGAIAAQMGAWVQEKGRMGARKGRVWCMGSSMACGSREGYASMVHGCEGVGLRVEEEKRGGKGNPVRERMHLEGERSYLSTPSVRLLSHSSVPIASTCLLLMLLMSKTGSSLVLLSASCHSRRTWAW